MCIRDRDLQRIYVKEHQLYLKAIIASHRGFCKEANENLDSYIKNYKGINRDYWIEMAKEKELDYAKFIQIQLTKAFN